jgi:integrase/recombinase XerD
VPDTQREYIRAVKRLTTFLRRSPDTATPEELRAFQLHLTASGVQPPTINATVTALRSFFKVTLDRPKTTRHVVFVYEPRKLPRVLSPMVFYMPWLSKTCRQLLLSLVRCCCRHC